MDKWDVAAQSLLPCQCGDYLHQGFGLHRSYCGTFRHEAVAAELRAAYLNGLEDARSIVKAKMSNDDLTAEKPTGGVDK